VRTPVAGKAPGVASEFERRAARAELLVRAAPAAEEPLAFAAGLYRAQARLASTLAAAHAEEPLTGRLEADVDRFLAPAAAVTRYAAESGPDALSEDAGQRLADAPATARERLHVFWEGNRTSSEDYLSRAILRPYVELLRAAGVPPHRSHRNGLCPLCGGAPWIGVRREGSQMEGARRLLACALCGGEWPFGRILCPSCFEADPRRLPAFTSEAHPTVRIEACETCQRYVKSIDLSEDARPIPEVDDLVSIAMDLWALEKGFERIEPGLAGI
jgi:formate dehydrogenase maturation protein FdhE